MGRGAHYAPLSSTHLDSDDSVDDKQPMLGGVKDRNVSKSLPSLKWNILLTWTIVLCTILNIAFYIRSSSSKEDPSQKTPLPRPNQFIGLDKLSYNRSLLNEDQLSLTTFATFIHQVDRTRPDEVLPSSGKLEFTTFGAITPEGRRFLATEQVSTILQFRARDYGMEHCKLTLTLPAEFEGLSRRNTDMQESHHEHEHGHATMTKDSERGWSLSGDSTDLEIWTLDAKDWLSVFSLSYSTLPKKVKRLGGLSVRRGKAVSTHTFPCESDSIHSFEVFCVSPGCRVEIWQDRTKPVVGISLTQHSSL